MNFKIKMLNFACDPIYPGASPKCLSASLLFGPLNNKVSFPVGALIANSSKVMHFPPFAVILFLADSENLSAQICNPFGNESMRSSSSTLQTQTIIF